MECLLILQGNRESTDDVVLSSEQRDLDIASLNLFLLRNLFIVS